MKVLITEKQLKKLIGKIDKDIDEGEEPAGEPTSGASGEQKGGKGYPEVSIWSDDVGSKVSRGVANQIKTTKWSDLIGLNREGPAVKLN